MSESDVRSFPNDESNHPAALINFGGSIRNSVLGLALGPKFSNSEQARLADWAAVTSETQSGGEIVTAIALANPGSEPGIGFRQLVAVRLAAPLREAPQFLRTFGGDTEGFLALRSPQNSKPLRLALGSGKLYGGQATAERPLGSEIAVRSLPPEPNQGAELTDLKIQRAGLPPLRVNYAGDQMEIWNSHLLSFRGLFADRIIQVAAQPQFGPMEAEKLPPLATLFVLTRSNTQPMLTTVHMLQVSWRGIVRSISSLEMDLGVQREGR